MEKQSRGINSKKVNELIKTGNKILKILFILFIILLIYVVTLIVGEWNIINFIVKILSILSPLFIGWFIAWILNPSVVRMTEKGVKRPLAVLISFVGMLAIIGLILAFTLPSLGEQVTEVVSSVPQIVDDVKLWIDNLFIKLSDLSLQNLDSVKASFLLKIEEFALSVQTNLPELVINAVTNVISSLGTILLSFILAVYILLDFDKFSVNFIELFPKKVRKDVNTLLGKLNESLYSFVSGTIWLSILLFIVSVIGFSIIGLNAPVLVAFVCVITNLIPYIGPYLGAGVAAVIGFTQSPLIGILTLVFILIVQTLEGNILQPLVMSKKMNLSPITIILSLLVFNYMFGVLGMVIATPVVALIKIIYVFFDEKYDFFDFIGKEENDD